MWVISKFERSGTYRTEEWLSVYEFVNFVYILLKKYR